MSINFTELVQKYLKSQITLKTGLTASNYKTAAK